MNSRDRNKATAAADPLFSPHTARPVEIHACLYDGKVETAKDLAARYGGISLSVTDGKFNGSLVVSTVDGVAAVNPGDYIVVGRHGELQPMRARMFHEAFTASIEIASPT